MDRISPTLIYTFTLAIFRLGWLPVIFHKFVTELWRLINVFTAMNSAIVRFSDNFRCYAYVNILVVLWDYGAYFIPLKATNKFQYWRDAGHTSKPSYTSILCNGVATKLKIYAHQRETIGTSSDFLQLRPFSKCELLKGNNSLPEGASGSEFFPLRAVLYGMEIHFYHNRWPPLRVTILSTHMRKCVMGATANSWII